MSSSDAPTGRFGRTVGSVSDKQWVRLFLAKNYRTPNSSVALFFNIFTCFTQNFNVKNRNSSNRKHSEFMILIGSMCIHCSNKHHDT